MEALGARRDADAYQAELHGAVELGGGVRGHWVDAGDACQATRVRADHFRHELVGNGGIEELGTEAMHQRGGHRLGGALVRGGGGFEARPAKGRHAAQRLGHLAAKLLGCVEDSG